MEHGGGAGKAKDAATSHGVPGQAIYFRDLELGAGVAVDFHPDADLDDFGRRPLHGVLLPN
jgi:hypothetical protein